MALISDILCGPYGDPQSDVVITMRAQGTSSKVLISNSSAATTDAGGKYSMQVFPGRYEVLVSTLGKIGEIQVFSDSKDGTLNDFLLAPDEDELTPAIVQTVDTMRAETALSADKSAASAAAAKQSEDNSAATLAGAVKESSRAVIVPAVVNAIGNFQGYLKLATLPITSTGVNGVHFMVAAGRTYGTPGMDIKFVQFSARNASTTALDSRGLKVASLGPAGQDVKFGAIYNPQTARWELWMFGPAYSMPSVTILASSSSNAMSGIELLKDNTWQKTKPDGLTLVAEDKIYSGYNVTVDGNGFLKAASPIVKLSRDGSCELNDESQGVITERVSEGVYRVSGTLGFNADAQWGGSDGGIEVPLDRNKQPLIWVDYEVEPTGDLLIKTYHRTHPTAPAFARNEELGYDEGMPIDIPEGRWVDLRVEMPAVEESSPEIAVEKPELES
ncbi:prophage tail fiber N-terminal domain-containing protein [Serratia liquefaciens]|uniref:phage tail fiber protein n=1 Tax=Serratia liquefaciens TaxID=614 RepID=UPI002360559C|nr:prophage tail fiber N-terminal domain-containing protein [Serratia liquefaciens]